MIKVNIFRPLFLFLLTLCVSACFANDQDTADDKIGTEASYGFQGQLAALLQKGYDTFAITRIYDSTDSADKFIEKSWPKLNASSAILRSKSEFYYSPNLEVNKKHIGIVRLVFSDVATRDAAQKSIEMDGYLENTKILSRYFGFPRENQLILIYTESAADKGVIQIMKELASLK